jgi:hypothetical protein
VIPSSILHQNVAFELSHFMAYCLALRLRFNSAVQI